MDTSVSEAESAISSADLTTAPVKSSKEAYTFDKKPASSMKFAKITVEPALTELLALVKLDRSGVDQYITDHSASLSKLCTNLKNEDKVENRAHILVLEAQRLKLLYSYCNIFFVANPYIGLVPDVNYDDFVEAAVQNWSISIEKTAMPTKRIKENPSTEKRSKQDQQVCVKSVISATKNKNNLAKTQLEDVKIAGENVGDKKPPQNEAKCETDPVKSDQTNSQSQPTITTTTIEQESVSQISDKMGDLSMHERNTSSQSPDSHCVLPDVSSKNVSSRSIKQGDSIKAVFTRISELSGKLPSEGSSFNHINAEKLILLDLLALDSEKRDEYIVQCAINIDLLTTDATTNTLIINPACNLDALNQITSTAIQNCTRDVIGKSEIRSSPQNDNVISRKAALFQARLDEKAKAATEKEEKRLAEAAKHLVGKSKKGPPIAPSQDETKIPRKRGQRVKKTSCSSDTSAKTRNIEHSSVFRKSIMKSLLDIQSTVDYHGTTGLGQRSQPELYAKFLAKFEATVQRIQQKLNAVPIARPATKINLQSFPPKVPHSPMPTSMRSGPLTFEDAINNLIARFTPNARLEPLIPVKQYAHWTEEPQNMAKLDKCIQTLLDINLGKLVEGDIRINAYNVAQGYVTEKPSVVAATEETVRDALVESIVLRQCAMHGDVVQVFVFDANEQNKNSNNPKGFVCKILEKRNDRKVIGHLAINKSKDYVSLKPTTKRIVDVRIQKRLHEVLSPDIKLDDQMLYMAEIIGWQDEIPIGKITEMIGDRNTLETQNKAILLENRLELPSFSASILDSLPKESFEIPPEEYMARENLTAQYVFTIDPATARDLDDALSVEQLPNGNFRVGVHISDVTYFVPEFSELDEVVREQATSIYLVDGVYHMLPRSLCMTCSLLPGQDKLTFSVFFELTESGEIVSTRFARTIINSCVQLAYAHAQLMIVKPELEFQTDELPAIRPGFEASVIAEKVRLLHRLATPLRQKRLDRFCLTFNQPKIYFQLDPDSGEPVSFQRHTQSDANWLIEEFMLLANQTVAAQIHEHYPDEAILRNHVAPKLSSMESLEDKLRQYGFQLELKSAADISQTFNRLLSDPKHSETVRAVLSDMLMRQITRAQYFCSGDGKPLAHFGLSIPIYTHFTSPIRRYPDIMVHRLLAASLKLAHTPKRNPIQLQMIAERCNEQKYNAKLAGDSSTQLYFKQFVQKRGKLLMQAVVVEVANESTIEVMLLETGMKFKINLKNQSKCKWETVQSKPLCILVNFDQKSARDIRLEVFAEVRVELQVNKGNNIQANLVAQD